MFLKVLRRDTDEIGINFDVEIKGFFIIPCCKADLVRANGRQGTPTRPCAPDDHAIKAMGAYNKGFHKTPNIDRLASGGVVFENSYCLVNPLNF